MIDQEVAMHLGHLRVADAKPPAARLIDQLPGLPARRVLEGGAARAGVDRLRRGARLGDGVHLGEDLGRIAGTAFEQGLGEDHVVRHARMAIGEAHLRIGEAHRLAGAGEAPGLDEHILRLAAIGAAIHAQGAADGAGNAAQERETRDAGLGRRARHLHVGRAGAGAHAMARLDRHVGEALA